MSETKVPEELRFTKTHEWLRSEGGDLVVGITDHAQSELTDIVFVELPAVGTAVKAGDSVLVLESVKTVADLYAPVDGTISAVNGELKSHPERVNQDPYASGWIFRITPTGVVDLGNFLDAAGYRAALAGAAH